MWVPTLAYLKGLCVGEGSGTFTTATNLKNSWLGLTRAAFTPTVNTVLSNLTEANFTGYARQQLTSWSNPFVASNGLVQTEGPLCNFAPSDTVTPNSAYAGFIVGSDSVTLLLVEVLPAPVPLTSPTSLLAYVPRVGNDPASNFGQSLIGN